MQLYNLLPLLQNPFVSELYHHPQQSVPELLFQRGCIYYHSRGTLTLAILKFGIVRET